MFEWLSTGVLSNGEPLPDYLFSITPWIAGSFTYGGQNWWGNWLSPDGQLTQTIDAVQAIPAFVRKFSWDESGVPEPSLNQNQNPSQNQSPNQNLNPNQNPNLPEPKPEPIPGHMEWDSRLDGLGVKVSRANRSACVAVGLSQVPGLVRVSRQEQCVRSRRECRWHARRRGALRARSAGAAA